MPCEQAELEKTNKVPLLSKATTTVVYVIGIAKEFTEESSFS
jgi:hypothetical protein